MKKSILFCIYLMIIFSIYSYATISPITELLGVKLGATSEEVSEILGRPVKYENNMATYTNKYDNEVAAIIYDDNYKVFGIALSDPVSQVSVNGIKIGANANSIKKIYGKADKIEVSGQSVFWFYSKYNLLFELRLGDINTIMVANISKINEYRNNISKLTIAQGDVRVLKIAVESYYKNHEKTYPAATDYQTTLTQATPQILENNLYDIFSKKSTDLYEYELSKNGAYYIIYSKGLSGKGYALVSDDGIVQVYGDAIWESNGSLEDNTF